jgi:hypothetical protein
MLLIGGHDRRYLHDIISRAEEGLKKENGLTGYSSQAARSLNGRRREITPVKELPRVIIIITECSYLGKMQIEYEMYLEIRFRPGPGPKYC